MEHPGSMKSQQLSGLAKLHYCVLRTPMFFDTVEALPLHNLDSE